MTPTSDDSVVVQIIASILVSSTRKTRILTWASRQLTNLIHCSQISAVLVRFFGGFDEKVCSVLVRIW